MLSFFKKVIYFLRKFFAFAGPGYLVAVGYMDPGNWVTDLAGGSRYGYTLLSVIFIANLMAMVLQFCALKLGIASGKDLARACRDHYCPRVIFGLWILAEVAVIATDLAEVIGSAIALNLLFGIPLIIGVCVTAADVLILLMLAHRHARIVELIVTVLIAGIIGCFAIIIYSAQPNWFAIAAGLVPSRAIVTDPHLLYLAIGILGATVMPHNLYLHSALVAGKKSDNKRESIFYSALDLCIALTFAFFVNAAILIAAAAIFHEQGLFHIAEIQDAYHLFTPLLHAPWASTIFAIALLLSGQNSTLTGTLAGQVIMEGFINLSLPAWQRRLIGRILTIIPAVLGIIFFGECCLSQMMIISQVVLSLQLPFAIFPLIQLTNNKGLMGPYSNSKLLAMTATIIGVGIVAINILLIYFLIWPALAC